MQENSEAKQSKRRRHSAELKAEAVKAGQQPGVSIAAVALHYRLNANLLRRWIGEAQMSPRQSQSASELATPSAAFIALPLPPVTSAVAQEIIIELKRGDTIVTIRWPHSAATDCASWLQAWLR
jgi:transposase